ncbi:zinc finger protein 184-like [Dendronephthya gigantea]|uniref:zinc finger protein 184-like n=1 Tax=Dendronephthya gigantea TaxID=151771 RepID=UPI00106971B8|nr:zinc finger protein 184-like [Dendronephthya gigantea]
MVRTKNLSAASGRKQRIEGIVKNLSAKATSSPSNPDEKQAESVSVLGVRERSMDSITNRSSPFETVSYELPVGMQFFGIVASKQLLQGQKFGPFPGSIAQTVEPSVLNYSYISQIPDVEGNDYCLNLYKISFSSSKWLNCIERCTSHGEYNIVAYNTPAGIFLQTVRDVVPGQQLCVAYDQAYDLPQVLQTPVPAIQSLNTPSFVQGNVAEPFVNLRTTVGPEFLARIHEQRSPAFSLEMTNHVDNHVSADGNETESTEDVKPTYNVMTADVSETYYPPIEDSKIPLNENYTQISPAHVADEEGKLFKCTSCRGSFVTVEERNNHMETAHTAECSICKKVYTSSYLKEHMTFHYESSRVTCRVCAKVFSSISNLRKHEKKHEKRGFAVREKRRLFKCSECPETFNTEKYLEIHRRKHVLILPITCNDCGEVFAQKNLLRRHQAVVHKGIRPFSCRYCDKTFTQRGNLARHCRQAHAEKTATDNRLTKEKFLCRRRGCNQASFSSRELYIEHLQQHSGNARIYSCGDCSCVFSSAGNLSKHKKTLHGDSPGKQSVMKPSTTQSTVPPITLPASVPEIEAKYKCSQCQRPFQNHFQLNRHMRVHKEKKRELNRCDDCGKIFMTRSGLSKHIRYLRCVIKKEDSSPAKESDDSKSNILAENKSPKDSKVGREIRPTRAARESKVLRENKLENPFGCTTCGKNFTSAWYLKVHRRTHKNYHVPCELCGKMFSHVTNLAKHMKYIHQGVPVVRKPKEKPKPKTKGDAVNPELTCDKCDKTLANINSLAVHKQLHFGLKPFKCEFCDSRFTQKCNMKRHLGTCKMVLEQSNNSSRNQNHAPATPRAPGTSLAAGENSGRVPEPPSSPVF